MSEPSLFLIPAYVIGFVALATFFRQAWLYKNNPKKLFGYDVPYPHLDVWHPPTGCPLTEEELRARKVESAIRIVTTVLSSGFIFFLLLNGLYEFLIWLPSGSFLDGKVLPPRESASLVLSVTLWFYVMKYLAGAVEEHIVAAEKSSQNEKLLKLLQNMTFAMAYSGNDDFQEKVGAAETEIEAFLIKERIEDGRSSLYHALRKLAEQRANKTQSS